VPQARSLETTSELRFAHANYVMVNSYGCTPHGENCVEEKVQRGQGRGGRHEQPGGELAHEAEDKTCANACAHMMTVCSTFAIRVLALLTPFSM
jgi:hypothetical protein